MKRLITVLKTILPFLLLTPSHIINSQTNVTFEDFEYLIHFEEDVEESYIDSLRLVYNSDEIWITPLSNIRLWRVNSFPFTTPGSNVPIIDINGVVPPVKTKSGVDGIDFDLKMLIDPLAGPGVNGDLENFACAPNYSILIPTSENRVKVSIFDTGYSAQDLEETDYILPTTISSGYDYVDKDDDYTDLHGHGTHITGIISHVSQYISGNSEKIEFDIRRTHDANGQGNLSSVILAMDEAILDGSNIFNMSFSYSGSAGLDSKIFRHAINVAEQFNTLIIASAGNNSVTNDDPSMASYPSSFENESIISVASVNCEYSLSPFSNYGLNSVDIAAPGEFISGPSLANDLTLMSGTSQSTAVISGISVALSTHLDFFDFYRIKCSIEANANTSPKLDKLIKTGGVIDAQESLDNLESSSCTIIDKRSNRGNEVSSLKTVYPNPFYNSLHITLEENIEFIRIFSITGNLLKVEKVDSNEITISNLDHLQAGTYFIQMETQNDIQTQKVIKY